jgi:hypothetical protein
MVYNASDVVLPNNDCVVSFRSQPDQLPNNSATTQPGTIDFFILIYPLHALAMRSRSGVSAEH